MDLYQIPLNHPPFMVLKNYFSHWPGEFNVLEDLMAYLGVVLDKVVLEMHELGGFA